MDDQQPSRNYLLPIVSLLGLSIILIVILSFTFLSGAATTPTETVTPLPSTLTPTFTSTATETPTPTQSPRPTWTLKPSETPGPTSTLTPGPVPTSLPTLKPATPYKYNYRYELENWSPVEADALISLMDVYATPLSKSFINPVDPNFESGYYALAYSQEEALLRFPDSFLALEWRFGLANSLAHLDDSRAVEVFAQMLQEELESGQVRINGLSEWFEGYEDEFSLSLYPLTTQPGELSRQIIEIKGHGGAYLLLQELPTQVNIFALASSFDFKSNNESDFVVSDLTGDGASEVAVYFPPKMDDYLLKNPRVFSLAQLPPFELSFRPENPIDFKMNYQIDVVAIPNENGSNDLQYTARFFPACPVYITRSYQWDGTWFDPLPFQFSIEPRLGLEGFCEVIVNHASLSWGPQAALAISEPLLPRWPPTRDPSGDPYPPDAYDAWRYRLGVYNALLGYQLDAQDYFLQIINNPVVSNSRWIEPAQIFMDIYQDIGDIYSACQNAEFCYIREALQQLTRFSNTSSPSLALDYIEKHNVDVRASGYFDFDLDGEDERWMTVKHQDDLRLEFWILAHDQDGTKAMFVDYTNTSKPEPYYREPIEKPIIAQLKIGEGFIMQRNTYDGEPYIMHVDVEYNRPTFIKDGYNQALRDLFSGVEPSQVRQSLLDLQKSDRFAGDCFNFWICDQFYYTLGLTYELTGDVLPAVNTYVDLWWNYARNSLFTVMARQKLHFIPPPPTATPTPTSTRTPTLTTNPNATATSTATETTNPYPTP